MIMRPLLVNFVVYTPGLYSPGNTLIKNFSNCSDDIKCQLFLFCPTSKNVEDMSIFTNYTYSQIMENTH